MDHQKAKRIFHQVAELAAAEREAFLDAACAEDRPLRAEVESLLHAYDSAGPFLGGSTVVPALGAPGGRGGGEGPGSRIGPYAIVQLIGEGGFGSVYEAEQEQPVRRRVALKVIKAGMDTRQVIARFEAERQALAIMDHPNIAKVFDAGATDAGRPYFVMELVSGEPITTYCDAHSLTTAARLALFADVCNAVQHAHQKGIIHRDLKPSNVLVTVVDGKAIPKVIDFGIAKAVGGRLTERTLFTEHGALIGTPEYMSPEQAEVSGIDIDTRSDVYSLGVLLYELLTGTTPFEGRRLRSAAYAEVQRIIREEDPPKPSTRLSTMRDSLAGVAARRQTEPGMLSANVRGDLDWISMKCLEKDRARRYETANGLAQDIRRHLAGEPVLAAPPGAAYRIRKFVLRHRVGVAAGGLVAAALVLGLGAATWGFVSARRERDAKSIALARAVEAEAGEREQRKSTEAQRDKAEKVAEFMGSILHGASPAVALGRDPGVLREMLDAAARRIDSGELKVAPEAELHLRLMIGVTYDHIGASPAALSLLEPAEALARSLVPPGQPGSLDLARTLDRLGVALRLAGRPAESECKHRECLGMLRALVPGDHPDTAGALGNLAPACQALRRFDEAEALYSEALAMYRRLDRGESGEAASCLDHLATVLEATGRAEKAEPLLAEALEMKKRLFTGDDPRVAATMNNLAFVRLSLGRPEDAEPMFRQALEMRRRLYHEDHAFLAASLNNHAHALRFLKRYEEAEPLYAEAAAMQRRLTGETSPRLPDHLLALAMTRRALGRPADAEGPAREALDVAERVFPADHIGTATSLATVGRILVDQGRFADAEPFLRRSLDMRRRLDPGGSSVTYSALIDLAGCVDALGRGPEAEALRAEAAAMKDLFAPHAPPQSPADRPAPH